MAEYRTRPVRIEATQWDQDLLKVGPYGIRAPYWLLGALDPKHGNARLCGKIKQVGASAQVLTDAGTVMAQPGDWIVYWLATDHHLSVHKPAEFDRLYDLDERKARMRSTNENPRGKPARVMKLPPEEN
jgi:hypothetical protein